MIDTSGNKPVIQVKMFGGFTITMDDKSMGDSDNRSRKAWNLLSYLIINRRKDVSINELFQAIWQDGMQDNPYGALKTLVSGSGNDGGSRLSLTGPDTEPERGVYVESFLGAVH